MVEPLHRESCILPVPWSSIFVSSYFEHQRFQFHSLIRDTDQLGPIPYMPAHLGWELQGSQHNMPHELEICFSTILSTWISTTNLLQTPTKILPPLREITYLNLSFQNQFVQVPIFFSLFLVCIQFISFLYLKNYSSLTREYENEDTFPTQWHWGNWAYSAGTDQPTRTAAHPFWDFSPDLSHHPDWEHCIDFINQILSQAAIHHVFFSVHLTCVDLFYSPNISPQMFVNFLSGKKTISYWGCLAQCFVFVTLFLTEYYMLSVMAYDRHMTICSLLHYNSTMIKPLSPISGVLWWAWCRSYQPVARPFVNPTSSTISTVLTHLS